jgi:hypothetical protein
MSQFQIDREKIKEDAKRESDIADMRQHSNKLIQGFEAADETYSKRAIWELIQNARDLSEECDLEIVLDDTFFSFTHNGKPFDSKTLLSLIKQVSSKEYDKLENLNSSETDVREVGKYGTGFITTHAFGKKFLINGSLKISEDAYIELKDFIIDRVASNPVQLAGKLVEQQKSMFDLLGQGGIVSEVSNTTFKYLFSDDIEKTNAIQAVTKYVDFCIPIVMALNRRVKSITVSDKINHNYHSFKKGIREEVNGISKTPIIVDSNTIIDVFSKYVSEHDIEIILPLSSISETKAWDPRLARLFLYFPLIGTESFGINFIIHSGHFSPTEPRDGLHISSDNKQTEEKEISNRDIISKVSESIFDFMELKAKDVKDPINLAAIAFDTKSENLYLNTYYKDLKQLWVKRFKDFDLVETLAGRKAPNASKFLSPDFFVNNKDLDSIYDIVGRFWTNIPVKSLSAQWTEIVDAWEDSDIIYITVKDVAEKIQAEGSLLKFNSSVLIGFYTFINELGRSELFDEFKLLPNIKNDFVKKTLLNTATSIDKILLDVSDSIIPEIPQTFINEDFTLQHEYLDYSRKLLSKDLNSRIADLTNKITPDNLLADTVRNSLLLLCSTFPSLDNRGVRGDLMDFMTKYYNVTFADIHLPNIEENKIEYFVPLKCLLKNILSEFYKESISDINWVANNLNKLKEILNLLSSNKEFEEILNSTSIFPSQNYKLVSQDKLRIDDAIPGSLKDLYFDVLKRNVRDELSLGDTAMFLPHKNAKKGSELSIDINLFLETQGSYENINSHPSKSTILGIIKKITSSPEIWGRLFPAINERRATIMMSRITKENMKEDMFSILGLEDDKKVSLLGDLARNENMVLIIQLGKEALADQINTAVDFQFKHSIGVHIEDLLRIKVQNEIKRENIKVETKSQQGGQDIIIFDGEIPIYYIEVKSRWDTRSSITMSRDQMKRSVEQKELYSLCCVDMCDYHPEDGNRSYPADISLIIDRIKFITTIGTNIEPLISNALIFENQDEQAKLTGDYRAIIPQTIVTKEGIDFNPFMEMLYTLIKQRFNREVEV